MGLNGWVSIGIFLFSLQSSGGGHVETKDLGLSQEQQEQLKAQMGPEETLAELFFAYGVESGSGAADLERLLQEIDKGIQSKENPELSPEEFRKRVSDRLFVYRKLELDRVTPGERPVPSTPLPEPEPVAPAAALDGRSADGETLTLNGRRYPILRQDGSVVGFKSLSTGGWVTYFGTRSEGLRYDSATNTLERYVGDALGVATLEPVGFVNPATGLFQQTMDSILRLPEPYNPGVSLQPSCQGRLLCRVFRRWSR